MQSQQCSELTSEKLKIKTYKSGGGKGNSSDTHYCGGDEKSKGSDVVKIDPLYKTSGPKLYGIGVVENSKIYDAYDVFSWY